ncbi:MAG TPA: mandelate racemase/muconate lactonizing enzyme family protein, partial [Alphaproteobacteria bacterium]|nr:mandelate racemase/muconate lactonizing enzyme family protein [Alphaproteobacteria bacterium]
MAKVTGIRTIRIAERPNLIWVLVETNDGLTGLGESFRGAEAVEAAIHAQIAPWLLGRDARRIEAISRHLLTPYVGFHSASAEVRAASAIDIALWDLAGQRHGIPIHEALGGASRDSIPAYNTCAGYAYNTSGTERRAIGALDQTRGPYDDQIAFTRDAGALAESLLSEGYRAMKIWPFDPYAAPSGGHLIAPEDLKAGLEPFRKIREAVGTEMDVMVEFHSLWDLPTAQKIARALEEFEPYWFEDPLKADDLDALAEFASSTHVPVTASETLSGRPAFRELMEKGAAKIVMLDVS